LLSHTTRSIAIGFAGLGLVGALAGCAAPTATTGGTGGTGGTDSAVECGDAGPSAPSTATATGEYKDGDYCADGSYTAPSGTETVTVKLTLKDDTVTALTVDGHATAGTQKQYQDMFVSGIAGATVGKKLDALDGVSRVAGSSLTSGGFRTAVDKIKSDAAA
jgi:uncharacterized protein with FMN-binding domain